MREDVGDMGNAWDYFSHDQARSRAYHWGEDGLDPAEMPAPGVTAPFQTATARRS